MKYKKIKLVGIGLASILCIFMINTQNVSAANEAYVKITNKIGGNLHHGNQKQLVIKGRGK